MAFDLPIQTAGRRRLQKIRLEEQRLREQAEEEDYGLDLVRPPALELPRPPRMGSWDRFAPMDEDITEGEFLQDKQARQQPLTLEDFNSARSNRFRQETLRRNETGVDVTEEDESWRAPPRLFPTATQAPVSAPPEITLTERQLNADTTLQRIQEQYPKAAFRQEEPSFPPFGELSVGAAQVQSQSLGQNLLGLATGPLGALESVFTPIARFGAEITPISSLPKAVTPPLLAIEQATNILELIRNPTTDTGRLLAGRSNLYEFMNESVETSRTLPWYQNMAEGALYDPTIVYGSAKSLLRGIVYASELGGITVPIARASTKARPNLSPWENKRLGQINSALNAGKRRMKKAADAGNVDEAAKIRERLNTLTRDKAGLITKTPESQKLSQEAALSSRSTPSTQTDPLRRTLIPEGAVDVDISGARRAAMLEEFEQTPFEGMMVEDVFLGQDRSYMIKEFGLESAAAHNEFVAPLLDLSERIASVKTVDNPAMRQFLAKTGVNPGAAMDSDVGKAYLGFMQQRISSDEMVSTVMSSVFDFHMGKGWKGGQLGRSSHLLPLDRDGFWKGLKLKNGTSSKQLWYNVLEHPDRYDLTDAQQAFIKDYNQVTNVEIPALLDFHGINQRMRSRTQGEYYVPRSVDEIRGVLIRGASDPDIRRHIDDATEGFLNQGVRYSNDPRKVLELHLRWAYSKVAKKQLDDTLEPLSITATDLVSKPTRSAYQEAWALKSGLEVELRKTQRALKTVLGHVKVTGARESGLRRSRSYSIRNVHQLNKVINELEKLPFEESPGISLTGEVQPDQVFEGLKYAANRGRIMGKISEAKKQLKRVEARERVEGKMEGTASNLEDKLKARMKILTDYQDALKTELNSADMTWKLSKTKYLEELAAAKKKQGSPSELWGVNQPDDIPIATWHNKFFRREDADLLNKRLPMILGQEHISDKVFKSFEQFGNSVRFLSAALDFAMPFIQGLPVMATNPAAFARATLRHYQAFLDPSVQARLIRENINEYQWLAQHSVSVGDPEFFAALQAGKGFSPGALLEYLPKVGKETRDVMRWGGRQSFGRFMASYNVGLGWSRVQLLKGMRQSWKNIDSADPALKATAEAEIAQHIRNLTGALDSRALGVAPSQRAVEGMFLAFSPRLLRSTVALVKDATFNPTSPVGRRAARSLAVLASGATSVYVMTGFALGKDWEDIQAGLNPLNGKRFLSHKIGDDWIGVGGQVRAISQLLAGITIGAFTEPSSLISMDRYNNPLLKFLSGRGAPITETVGAVAERITGRDALPYEEIDGDLDLAKHIGTQGVPFVIQGKLEGEKALTLLAAELGARTSAGNVYDEREVARNKAMLRLGFVKEKGSFSSGWQAAQERIGFRQLGPNERVMDWSELNVEQQKEVMRQAELEDITGKIERNQREKNLITRNYRDNMDRIKDDMWTQVRGRATLYGRGKEFREALPKIYAEARGARNKFLESKEAVEAKKVFQERANDKEKRDKEHIENRAMNDYIDKFLSADLTNRFTGEYDWERAESIMKSLEDDYDRELGKEGAGKELIQRMQNLLREGEPPIIAELREAREVLRPYWALTEEAKGFHDEIEVEAFEEWLDANQKQRRILENDLYSYNLEPILKTWRSLKVSMRDDPDSGIEDTLITWGYAETPHTVAGLEAETLGIYEQQELERERQVQDPLAEQGVLAEPVGATSP